jgi:hypothetical protein
MKDILDKVIKKRKSNVEKIEEPITTKDEATEAMVKSIKEEAPYKVEPVVEVVVKKAEVPVKKAEVPVEKVKVPNPWPRPLHHPVCTCHKCERWKEAEKNA